MRHDTFILVRAARLEPRIGSYAARRYVERHLWNPEQHETVDDCARACCGGKGWIELESRRPSSSLTRFGGFLLAVCPFLPARWSKSTCISSRSRF